MSVVTATTCGPKNGMAVLGREPIQVPQQVPWRSRTWWTRCTQAADAVVFLDFDLKASVDHWPVESNKAAMAQALSEASQRPDLEVSTAYAATAITLRTPGGAPPREVTE